MKNKTTIRDVEKEYGVKFGVRKDMKLSTYLKRKGFISLSKALDRIEKKQWSILDELGTMSKEEYNYYENLPAL